MKTVALTGGIGSGKTAVCSILSSMGVPVYDSDSRARRLYDEKPDLVPDIERSLLEAGVKATLRTAGGKLDRKALAGIVFSSQHLRDIVESLVHPAVLDDFKEWKSRQENLPWQGPGKVPFVVIESAIITKKPLFRSLPDKVVEVRAASELRLKRVMKRDGAPEEEVVGRMKAQEGEETAPDAVILNDGGLGELEKKVTRVFSTLWNE